MVINIYIKELKHRFLYCLYGGLFCFLLVYNYSKEVFYLMAEPFCKLYGSGFFLSVNLFELLYGYIKISLIMGFNYMLFCSIIQMYLFLKPTFYKQINNKIKQLIYLNIFILIGIFIFIYNIGLPLIFMFVINLLSINFSGDYNLILEPQVLNYINIIINLIVLYYIILYIPLLILCIMNILKINLINKLRYRLWLYLIILIGILLLFPPDMFLHIIIFSLIFIFIEFIIIMYLLIYNYMKNIV